MNPIAKALSIASRNTDRNPSDARKDAGNYSKGKLRWNGETIAIENPKGSKRSGIDPNGKRWECTLPSAYGYFLGTVGKDNDHVDCYIGDDHDSKKVFVIDQIDAKTGKFDEHKVLLSFPDRDAAISNYKRSFSDGKGQERIGHVAEMTIERFGQWLHNGNTKAPIAKGYASGGSVHGGADMAGQDQSRKVMQAISLALETARRGSQGQQAKAGGGRVGRAEGGPTERPAELKEWKPSLYEDLVHKAGEVFGDTPDSHRAARDVLSPDDPLRKGFMQVAEPAAHMGAYFTPAAPLVGAYDVGGLLSDVAGGARKFYDTLTTPSSPFDEIKPATRDEFYASKRTQRGSVQEAQAAAENAVRNSESYSKAMDEGRRTTALKMLEDARKSALSAWQADQGSIGNEDARIESDWQAELADRKSRSDAELRKPWYERHPALGQAVGLGSLGVSALMARRGFNKIADTTNGLVGAAKTARAGGELGAEAEALAALNAQGRRLPWEYAKTVGKAALLPSGVRGVGTAGDAIAAPDIINADGSVDPTSARQQARALLEHTFTDPMGFASEMGPGLMTGLEGSAIGAILARKPAMAEMAAQRAFIPQSSLTKGRVSSSPDELALPLGDARAAMLRKQRELDELRALPPVRPQTEMPPQALGETTTTRPDILDIEPMNGPMGQRLRAKEIGPQSQSLPAPAIPNQAIVSSSGSPEVSRALSVARDRAIPTSLPQSLPTSEAGNNVIRHFKKENIIVRKEGEREVARFAPGRPEGGQWTSHPKRGRSRASKDNTSTPLTKSEDVAVDKNGIPIKPARLPDPDDPINRGMASGGAARHVFALARKYARGGVVVGPVIGHTGGRADELPVSVPAGAFVLPADTVASLGGSNSLAGVKALDEMFGGARESRADGGAVPIKISDGEYVLSPEQVTQIGGGNIEQGHRILEKFVIDARRKHIDTLKSLPGPSR